MANIHAHIRIDSMNCVVVRQASWSRYDFLSYGSNTWHHLDAFVSWKFLYMFDHVHQQNNDMDAWLDWVLNWIASNFMLNVTQCSIVRYFVDLPYNTLASPVSKEYKMFFKEHWWLFGKLTPLRAAAPMLHICAQFSAQKSPDLSEVLDLSYERWQFSDFQGARTSWGTQNDLWKSRLLLPASQDINRYTRKSWDEWLEHHGTAILSQNATHVLWPIRSW